MSRLPNRDGVGFIASFSNRLWCFFRSVQLMVVLLLILIGLSLIGIFLIQTPPNVSAGSLEYTRWLENVIRPNFGVWTDTLLFFGLFDVFHSLLFLGASVLLMINILCCTIGRWHTIKLSLWDSNIPTNLDYYHDTPLVHRTLSSVSTAVLSLTNILKMHHYRIHIKESNSSVFIAAERYAFSRLGTIVSHLSIILLVLGLLLGSFMGFRDETFILTEGTVQDIGHDTGLALGLISFNADYWPDGTPRNYCSEVAVYQDDRQVTRDTIRINHPLTYSGVRFYQSFFGPAITMKVQTNEGIEVTKSTVALIGIMEAEPFQRPLGKLELPDTGLTGYLILPARNFADPILAENQIGLEIYQDEATVPLNWVILDKGIPKELEGLEFTYLEKRAFSEFSVKYDPGLWLVWSAFGLFFVGISMVFYLPFRQVCIMVKPEEEDNVIYIRFSDKLGLDVRADFEKLYKEITILLPCRTAERERGLCDG